MEQGNKRILFVANSGPMHINKFHLEYIQNLIDLGHSIDIATEKSSSVPIMCKKIEVPFGLGISISKIFKSYSLLKKISKSHDYDIIYTHTAVASALSRIIFKNQRKKGTRIIYMVHGLHFTKGSSIKNWMLYYPVERLLSYYTDDLILINKRDYEFARKKLKARNFHHLKGVGVNTDLFKNLNNRGVFCHRRDNNDRINLFYAADLNINKNQKVLIDMMSKLVKQFPNCSLKLAGEGPTKTSLNKYIIEKSLDKNVFLLGFISKEEVALHLSQADLVVASSLREGLPVNIIEALSAGVPVVATDVRGHNELIHNGINGYLVDGSIDDFYDKVCYLLMNNRVRNIQSRYAYELSKMYDINEIKDGLLDILFNENRRIDKRLVRKNDVKY